MTNIGNCKDCKSFNLEKSMCFSPNMRSEEVDNLISRQYGDLPNYIDHGVVVEAGDYYAAKMIVGQNFGCVNFEAK